MGRPRKEDPMMSHAKELFLRDEANQKLKAENDILLSHYRKAAAILGEYTDALSEAADALSQCLFRGEINPTYAASTADLCRKAIEKRMAQVAAIHEHVTTEFDALQDELADAKETIRLYRKAEEAYRTWRTRLQEWMLSFEDGAYKFTHFRYQTVISVDFAEAVALALLNHKEEHEGKENNEETAGEKGQTGQGSGPGD